MHASRACSPLPRRLPHARGAAAHAVASPGCLGLVALLVLGSGPGGAVGGVAEVPGRAGPDAAAGLEADDGVAVRLARVYRGLPLGAEPLVVSAISPSCGRPPAC